MKNEERQLLSRIAVVGNYLPRQCGIATFTTDLCEAIAAEYPDVTCFAVPVNDTESGYDYPPRVRFEIAQNDLASYQRAADFLNINNVDIVCLQHEYGIFGGPAGSHILALLRDLRPPIVTTLHTVLRQPEAGQRKVLAEIAALSDRLVVMSQHGARFLEETYGIKPRKIEVIPHGIPDVPFVDPNYYKDHFGVEGKMVLLTSGLLSPNKGIETLIGALPKILAARPDVVYMVLGATHPHVKRRDGESYRISLQRLAVELGVEKSVLFHNRFVNPEELIEFMGAAVSSPSASRRPSRMPSWSCCRTGASVTRFGRRRTCWGARWSGPRWRAVTWRASRRPGGNEAGGPVPASPRGPWTAGRGSSPPSGSTTSAGSRTPQASSSTRYIPCRITPRAMRQTTMPAR